MDKFLAFTLIGLSTGAIYAVAASGLVLTYTTSGIFNLAHGATGMLAVFVYWQLRFDWDWPAPLALFVTLCVLCPLYGAFTERVIMRGLQDTSDVVKLSVTVGLFAASLGLANWIWPSDSGREAFLGFFDGNTVEVFGYNLSWHKIITFGCAVAVAIILRLALYRTRAGVAMRAVVDDRSLAQLNGSNPDRVSMLAWAGSASLAGLAGILLAGEVQLNIEPLVLLVINAYAAAIVGRLKNLPMTFLGALLIGLLDAYYLAYSTTDWFPKTAFGFSLAGIRSAIPIIVLFVALILMPQTRLRAGVVKVREDNRAPNWSTVAIGCVALIGFTVMISGMLTRANTLYVIDGFLFAIAALSLVPLTGYAGQVSLAPLTFAGLGAIAMSKLPGNGSVLTLIGVMVIVGIVGAIVALPALRLQGIYLALATAAFAVLVSKLVFNQRQTFGAGNISVPPLNIPGLDLSDPRARLITLAVCFSILAAAVIGVRRSPLGRRLIAMKDSPVAGATLGMNLTATKVAAFAISAAIASCAGALAGRQVSPNEYDFVKGLPIVLLAVVGGVGSVAGALFGGISFGANVAMASIIVAMKDVAKVLPGIIGISLGRNPAGVASQVSEGLRPLIGRWGLIGVALAGPVGLWALTTVDVITRWSFVGSMLMWVIAVVGSLITLADGPRSKLVPGLVVLGVGMAVMMFVDWGTAMPTAGWAVLVIIVLVTLVYQVAKRVLDTTPHVAKESPDAFGLDRAFTDIEVERAERQVGVTL
jgi:branched-chain amino acid transport system permease protein